MTDINTLFGNIGGAVSDLFAVQGSAASASSFGAAAGIAEQNAEITQNSTQIAETQAERQVFQGLGTVGADVGNAGFENAGDAQTLLQESAEQGALTEAVTAEQGQIQENSYAEQAGMFAGMEKSAEAAGTAQTIAGALGAAGSLLSLGSSSYKLLSNIFGPAGSTTTNAASGIAGGVPEDLSGLESGDLGSFSAAEDTGGLVSATGDASGVVTATEDTGLLTDASGSLIGSDLGVVGVGAGLGGLIGGEIGGNTGAEVGTGLGAAAAIGILAWVICTELVRQERMPRRWWATGSRVFTAYPEPVKRGYYVWAVPSVRHLRRRPHSLYSRFLCAIFNWRAENIAAHAGVRGARKLWRGAAVTAVLWPLCYAIGVLVPVQDWKVLYAR